MYKTITRLLSAVGGLLALSLPSLAQTSYVQAPLTPASYNQDIMVEGTGTAASKATSDMDGGNAATSNSWCYVVAGYVNPAGASPTPPTTGTGLPTNGIVPLNPTGAPTPSTLSFQLAPYTGNNSLRLTSATPTGTMTLVTPTSAGYVYLLNASGNAPTTSTFTATVNFTDGTTQVFTSLSSQDWFNGTSGIVIQGLGRVNYTSNVFDTGVGTTNPRMYQTTLALLPANYGKIIQSITIARTAATTALALNVMGVSLGLVCSLPTGISAVASATSVCPGTSVNLSTIATANGYGNTYQWQQSTDGGTTFTNITGATAPTYTVAPTVTTQYQLLISCGATTITAGPVTVTVSSVTAALAYGTAGSAAAFCQNSGLQAVVTATPGGGTFTASPTGLSINATTGTITPGTSTPGIYTVTYTPPVSSCATITTAIVAIDAPPTVAVTYSAASFCAAAGTVQPATATPVGGTFAGSPGLVINALTGAVDLALTPAGTYTVGYTSFGSCATTATTVLTVLPAQPASLSFNAASFCQNGAAPVPTVAPAGGTFSGPAALVLNASTGAIDLTATPAGTYQVSYIGPGPCASAATASVTVLPVPAVSVSYPGSPYCKAGTNPVPTFAPAGGTFTGSAGLVINASTGVINLASTPAGTYTVRYTNAGPCTSTATASVVVTPVQTVALSFNGTTFCKAGTAPVTTATPSGGTFTATGGLPINPSTGAIDLANAATGTYTVTYVSAGFCASQATATLTIQGNSAPLYPTVLTPNGDGLNDVLKFKLADVQNYSLQVYSRWGRQVYEGHNLAEGWNPADNTAGTYYYLVEYTDCAGKALMAKNWVEVIK